MQKRSKDTVVSLEDFLVSKSRMSDQVKELLKELVLTRNVGDRIPAENEIARQLGVSKVTVRQALGNLEAQGLIERRRGINGGNFVAKPTSSNMTELVGNYFRMGDVTAQNLMEFRCALEPAIAKLAALRVTNAELQKVKNVIDDLENNLNRATTLKELQLGRSKVTEFHVLVGEASHNPFVSHVMIGMATVLQTVLDQLPPTDFETAGRFVDHAKRLYNALKQRNDSGAYEAMLKLCEMYATRASRNKSSRPLRKKGSTNEATHQNSSTDGGRQ
ncbi:MAG TPA: FCD domain-containing protein [Syntrophorhabdaceae bacterium]|nr:FCD domain-containing protein [Syntrophorhabdaceae bacterium]